ncbi:hypothetical protein CC79DRAFT_1332751 [Sarocladium strictum]
MNGTRSTLPLRCLINQLRLLQGSTSIGTAWLENLCQANSLLIGLGALPRMQGLITVC